MKLSRKDIVEFVAFVAIITIASAVKFAINRNDESPILSTPLKEYKSDHVQIVFIDMNGTLHTSSDCKGIKSFMTVDTISINDFRKKYLEKICARCISESQLEELARIK